MGSGSALVPSDERPLVQAQAHRVRRRVVRQPGQSRVQHRRVCFQVAAIAPGLPVDRLSLLARYTSWSIILDDRLDSPAVDQPGLHQLLRDVALVTAGYRDQLTDPLLVLLAGILDDLARYDRTGAVVTKFRGTLVDAIECGVRHSLLGREIARGDAQLPSAERYLHVAARTVNYHSFAYALLAVGDVSLTRPQLACLGEAVWQGACAVRLANDLRSLARDRAELTLNVLHLRTEQGDPVTPEYVQAQIDKRVRAHDRTLAAIARLGAIPAGPARALTRSLAHVVRFYRRTDLR